ncbi:hypothetical protein [Streptomyces xanthophaeus]|uniref:hypothetical protein n=1 Tax=Streptomyces xanthophaeus TaxID=67385 RepID=UPI00131B9C9B|nr:hypothetical protein [Streptomyces xanthophaeus]
MGLTERQKSADPTSFSRAEAVANRTSAGRIRRLPTTERGVAACSEPANQKLFAASNGPTLANRPTKDVLRRASVCATCVLRESCGWAIPWPAGHEPAEDA